MRYLHYCILFLVIILYSITQSVLEGYGSYADRYKDIQGQYSAQDIVNVPKVDTRDYSMSVGSTVSSTEYPFKMGTVTRIPTNSYDNIEITYPGELTPKSVKRSSITLLSDPTQTAEERPLWLKSDDHVDTRSYTYNPNNLSKYKTISPKDDIYTPNSRFKDERYRYKESNNYIYDLSGNKRYYRRPSAYKADSSLLKEEDLYTIWDNESKDKKPNVVSNVKSKIGSWFSTKKPSPSMDKTVLIPENDILGDYTSPPVQTYSKDPMGYTADSATINKIYQLLNSMVTKNHCETSAHGCCKDKLTAKSDRAGSNCSEAIVVGLTDDVKKYIDTSISEKTYSFTPSTSALLQTKLPSTRSESSVQNSYTNTVFLAQPKGFDPPAACPQSSFDSRITPTYSHVDSEVLPLPSLTTVNH
jgi:hypothetical protein